MAQSVGTRQNWPQEADRNDCDEVFSAQFTAFGPSRRASKTPDDPLRSKEVLGWIESPLRSPS